MKTRILVLGVGGVGGFYGGMLARHYRNSASVEVTFIARGKHLEKIRTTGLKIRTPDQQFIAMPFLATDHPFREGIFNVILFCVKSYDLENSAELIMNNVAPGTVVLPLMNGIEGIEKLRLLFPSQHVFDGCCYLNSFREEAGVIRHRGGFDQVLMGYPETRILEPVRKLFTDAAIHVLASPDISVEVWTKYLFGSPISGVCALYLEPFGAILADADKKELLTELMKELVAVAHAKGVNFPDSIINDTLTKMATYPYEARPSMMLDVEKGNRSELETFIGYIVRCGEALNIATPLYKDIYRKLNKTS